MILYTMMPHELIFPSEMSDISSQQMVTYQGIPLLVDASDNQNVQVIRVLSTDPQHFMDERICPGAKISFTNVKGLSAF